MTERARILLLTGSGKGKTTAAMGVLLRSLAAGKKALLVRFAKARRSGELDILESMPGMTVKHSARGMTPPPEHPDFALHVAEAVRLFAETENEAENFDALVLDEICGIVARGMIPEERVVAFLDGLRGEQLAVLTGRGAGAGLIAAADTVSEVLAIKHGYRRGILAQEGVEF